MNPRPQGTGAATTAVSGCPMLQAALELQRQAYARDPVPTDRQRVADLRTLRRFIRENRDDLIEAVNRDYGSRSRHETMFGELVPVLDGVKHTLKHLRGWMRPQHRSVDLLLFPGARNRVLPHKAATIEYLLEQVMSGGVTVNDALWHVGQHELPFGGVGASGMGHYHGWEGFVTFSKLRPVFYQGRVSGMRLLWPPFGALGDTVLNFLTK